VSSCLFGHKTPFYDQEGKAT